MKTRKQAPTSAEPAFASIEELAPLLAHRKISSVELANAFFERIERHNPALNAYITVTRELALTEALRADKRRHAGRARGPLDGIPLALKDNLWTAGVRTTAGSKVLRDFVPAQDATAVTRLRRAGAVLLGKTNLHEFAYGITTVNPHYGATRNPWDLERIPGGSSGGSAAAMAGDLPTSSFHEPIHGQAEAGGRQEVDLGHLGAGEGWQGGRGPRHRFRE